MPSSQLSRKPTIQRVGSDEADRNHEFDRERYDAKGDVLYLSRGAERSAATTFATPEGHAVRLDEAGEVIRLTIVYAKWLLDRDGKLVVTIPERVESPRADAEPALSLSS